MKAIQCNEFNGLGILSFIGKNLSLYVYIYHIAVGKCFDIVASRHHLWRVEWFQNSRAFMVLGVTLVVSLLFFYSKKLFTKLIAKIFKKESHA